MLAYVFIILAVCALIVALVANRKEEAARRKLADMHAAETISCAAAAATASGNVVELSASAQIDKPLVSPYTKTPCVWWSVLTTEEYTTTTMVTVSDGKTTRVEPQIQTHTRTLDDRESTAVFALGDTTGSIVVDPAGAEIEAVRSSSETVGSQTRKEWLIPVDAKLYLLGAAHDGKIGEVEGKRYLISVHSEQEVAEQTKRSAQTAAAVAQASLVLAPILGCAGFYFFFS